VWDSVCATMSVGLLVVCMCGAHGRWSTTEVKVMQARADGLMLSARSRTGGTRHVQDVGGEHTVRYSRQFGGLGLKTTKRYGWRILLSLGLNTRRRRFQGESVAARGITSKGASSQSNFVPSVWPSDRKPRSWSISSPRVVDKLYVNMGSLGNGNNPL
jgi:hypothetical protein